MSHSSSKNNGENSSSSPPPSPPQSITHEVNNQNISTPPPSPLLDPQSITEGNNQNIINEEENTNSTPPTPVPSPLLDPQSSEGRNQVVDGDDINSSSSDLVVAAPPPNPAEPVENNEGQGELEIYGCKYCNKKFSNKQALGGHQNAHKSERQLEKKALEVRETAFGYYGSGPGGPSSQPQVSHAPFSVNNVNSFNRSREALLNRPPMHMPPPVYRPMPNYQTQRPPMHMPNYVARPMPARPMVPGLNPLYVWNGPAPTLPRFVGPSNWPIQYQTMTLNPHQFVMNAPRFMPPGINQVGAPNNNQVMINGTGTGEQAVQENEDSDIDLTLRL